MSPYEIRWKKSAAKELSKLDRPVKLRIAEAAEKLAANPYPPDSKPLQGHPGKRRIHCGPGNDWVIVYQVINDRLIVEVVRVRHRSKSYENL